MKKQNKRNQFTRMALALLLILSMLGNTLILPTVAQETVAPVDDTTSSETPSADEATTATTATPTLPEPILLTAADIPEFISAAALTERGAVERMRSEETNMSSVIFRNSDGTRTMYMYGLPVKYTAADGTVRDKSTNLVSVSTASVLLSDQPVAQTMAQMSLVQKEALQAELGILDAERAADTLHMLSTALTARQRSLSDMAYTTLDNDVYALFPTNLAKGMTLVFGEHSVRMTPAGTGMTVTAGGNVTKTTTSSLSDADVTERLLYPNVFGLGTAVQYTPTLTGVKEEILLSRNVGKNSFAFLLETGGLVLTEQNGQFILIDPETEQRVGKLGEIIVFDSAGQIVRGNMTAQTILAGQKYGIMISVDQEFLASATYPVSIDPSISSYVLDVYGSRKNAIEDTGVYNHEDAWEWTFETHHYLGAIPYTNGGTYVGFALYRFPIFYNASLNGNFTVLDSEQVGSFKLHLKSIDVSPSADTSAVFVSPYLRDWDDNARICSMEASCYRDYSSSLNFNAFDIPTQGAFEIDLTDYLKYWLDVRNGTVTATTTADFETGVAIGLHGSVLLQLEAVADDTDIYATYDFAPPARVGTVYLNNMYTRTFLGRDATGKLSLKSGLVSTIGDQIAWDIEYLGDDQYAIHPCGAPTMYLDGSGNIVESNGSPSTFLRWTFSGTNVNICNVANGKYLGVGTDKEVTIGTEDAFSDDQKAWRKVQTTAYVELDNIDVYFDGKLYDETNPYKELVIGWEEIVGFTIDYNENSSFISSGDFEYTAHGSYVINVGLVSLVSGDENGSMWKGVLYGDNYILVRHIPTNISKTVKFHYKGCTEDPSTYYPDHDFAEFVGDSDYVMCRNCSRAITIAEYYLYVGDDENDDDWPVPTTYPTQATKDAAVISKADELFRFTIPQDVNSPSYECIAGIYKTTENEYIVSDYRTSNLVGAVSVFKFYSGVPSDAILVGFVHTHALTGTDEKFSVDDIKNSYTLHDDKRYSDVLQLDQAFIGEDGDIEVQFTEDYLIRPTSRNTYEIWKIDVSAQTTEEAYDNQILVATKSIS